MAPQEDLIAMGLTAEQTAKKILIERAREAVNTLRDAVRAGRTIDFRQRDPLVLTIHHALDLAEETVEEG